MARAQHSSSLLSITMISQILLRYKLSHLTNVCGVVTLSNTNFLALAIYVRVEYKFEASGLRTSKTPSNLLLISELALCSVGKICQNLIIQRIFINLSENKRT